MLSVAALLAFAAAVVAQTTPTPPMPTYTVNMFFTAPLTNLTGVQCASISPAVWTLLQSTGSTSVTYPPNSQSSAVCNPVAVASIVGASVVVRFGASADANTFSSLITTNFDSLATQAGLPCNTQVAVSGFQNGQTRFFCTAPSVTGLTSTVLISSPSLCCSSTPAPPNPPPVTSPSPPPPSPPTPPSPPPPLSGPPAPPKPAPSPPKPVSPPPPLQSPSPPPPPKVSPPPPRPTPTAGLPGGPTSPYWGVSGELWDPSDRLIDWSYAGYAGNNKPIPFVPQVADVKVNFGARGDGNTDDTQAFLNAINSIQNGALYVPPGRYVIKSRLVITTPNVVIRGAGQDVTTLYFPKSMTDLYGNNPIPPQNTQWSFGPGLLHFQGVDPYGPLEGRPYMGAPNTNPNLLTTVTGDASRGDYVIQVGTTTGISAGDWVLLAIDGGPLVLRDLNGFLVDPEDACIDRLCSWDNRAYSNHRWPTRVSSIDQPNSILHLERPLPYNISMTWNRTTSVYRYAYTLTEVGVESLNIEFPLTTYPGHLREKGYNGLYYEATTNCWARNVKIINADVSLLTNRTHFCTFLNVTTTTNGYRGAKGQGHHGIDILRSSDVLVTGFYIQTPVLHDLSTEWMNVGVVFANGRGTDVNMDHHREQNYGTLWSNIDIGLGSRPFDSSGDGNYRGLHAGALSTFWNIRSSLGSTIYLPDADFGPLLNFIGMNTYPPYLDPTVYWRSPVLQYLPAGQTISPPDLWSAMLSTRAQRLGAGAARAGGRRLLQQDQELQDLQAIADHQLEQQQKQQAWEEPDQLLRQLQEGHSVDVASHLHHHHHRSLLESLSSSLEPGLLIHHDAFLADTRAAHEVLHTGAGDAAYHTLLKEGIAAEVAEAVVGHQARRGLLEQHAGDGHTFSHTLGHTTSGRSEDFLPATEYPWEEINNYGRPHELHQRRRAH